MITMWEIDSILEKFKNSIELDDDYVDMQFKRKSWNELKYISIEKLNNKEHIDEAWLKKAEVVFEKDIPLEACLLFNSYLNEIKSSIDINIDYYNDKIIDILYSKTTFNLNGVVLLEYIKNIFINPQNQYKFTLLNRKLNSLKKIEIKEKITSKKLIGIKINNINKLELTYYVPNIENYIYIPDEDFEVIDLTTGVVLCKYKKANNFKRKNSYEVVLNNFNIKTNKMDINNKFERMLLYEVCIKIYNDGVSVKLNKNILNTIVDNIDLFSDEYVEKFSKIANIHSNNINKHIEELTQNPVNEELKNIIEKAEQVEEIFSIIKQAEDILKEDIRLDIYVDAISKCYEIDKNNINIALFCEELISDKPIIFTEVIDILKNMYEEKIFTNKTLDTLRYIKHTVKDEQIIDAILLQSKYENSEFDNDFINKIYEMQKKTTAKDLKLIDKMLNKFIYNIDDLSGYSDKAFICLYRFYKRNKDINTLYKLCNFIYKNGKSLKLYNITEDDVLDLIDLYKKTEKNIATEDKLRLIDEFKDNKKILEYGKIVLENIYAQKEKVGIDLLNTKYKDLLKILRKRSNLVYEAYLKMLELKDQKSSILEELSKFDCEDIEDIKKILYSKTSTVNTKMYMLKILISYYIVKLDYDNMLKYMNLYINKYSGNDKGELFKNILYNQANNIEFIENILLNLDFNFIKNAELFLNIISVKLIKHGRIDLFPEILRYYIANEKYEESLSILEKYISKYIENGNLIKENKVEIDEIKYAAFILPILDNIDKKQQTEIYKLLIRRHDLPILIREKYYELSPTKENIECLINAFICQETVSVLSKELALEKYYHDDIEFCRLMNIGKENNIKILDLAYKKVEEKFKEDKDYVEDLIKNIYNENEKLKKIHNCIEIYLDNIFDISTQTIFGEYLCTAKRNGEYCDDLYLINIFKKNNMQAVAFKDDEFIERDKLQNTIEKYFKSIKVEYYEIEESVIVTKEKNDIDFIKSGNLLKFIENIKLLLILQLNLISIGKMLIEFKTDSFIINEKGFIPRSFKYISEYKEEFRTKNKEPFEIEDKMKKGNYFIVNENNICLLVKSYAKKILEQIEFHSECSKIKCRFIELILENDSINKYETIISSIDLFIEKEKKSFENITYKEKLRTFYALEIFEQSEVIDSIISRGDTSLIAKRLVINYNDRIFDVDSYIKYLIDCFNNSTIGFEVDDFVNIYEKVNHHINNMSQIEIDNFKNEIFNFYISAPILSKISNDDIKKDVKNLNLKENDKDYIINRL